MLDFTTSQLLMVFFGAVAFVGGIMLNLQIYKMTTIDAKARGLKHPRFWGIFNVGGNNASGNLIFYLIGRRRYPILHLSEADEMEMKKRKKNAGLAIVFSVIGSLGFLFFFLGADKFLA